MGVVKNEDFLTELKRQSSLDYKLWVEASVDLEIAKKRGKEELNEFMDVCTFHWERYHAAMELIQEQEKEDGDGSVPSPPGD